MIQMRSVQRLTPLAAAGFALIAGAVPAIGLLAPTLHCSAPLAIGVVMVLCAIPLLRWWAIVLALPLCGLLPLATWPGVVFGMIATWALLMWRSERTPPPDPDQVRELRAELRDAEHERTLLHRHIQRYPILMEACLELSGARSLDQFATVLCRRTSDLLGDISHVRVYLGTAKEQKCIASIDQDGKPCPLAPDESQYYVAREARPLVRRDGRGVRLLSPLRGDRRQVENDKALRGVLDVNIVSEDVGDRLALELVNALGRLGGLGLGAVDLVDQARSLALHDDLTGLFGQHEFMRRLEEQAAACRRANQELGIIMCDMDHLKRCNDTYGHAVGDAALRQVAEIMDIVLPDDAIACRYGGEEFAAIIVGQSLEGLKICAQDLCTAIANKPVIFEKTTVRVSASLGVALWNREETPREALVRADGACYAAKSAGRNRVEVAT